MITRPICGMSPLATGTPTRNLRAGGGGGVLPVPGVWPTDVRVGTLVVDVGGELIDVGEGLDSKGNQWPAAAVAT